MSMRNLGQLFQPTSVAVIGASDVPRSVGATVLRNILIAGFKGHVMPVCASHAELSGQKTYPSIADLPEAPDLALICVPAAEVPQCIRELGARGTKAAIVFSPGLSEARDEEGRALCSRMLAEARPHLLRILGPHSAGMLAPDIGLNASITHIGASPGRIAFVSQSGAMVTAVLDWASARGIGFSRFISMGESADVDFGDVIDYLASDSNTTAILLYVEGIRCARKFMSAARAAARVKPTLIIKAGRQSEAAQAAALHAGALAGSDAVYDAAIRRAGMLRVDTTEDLFDAVETLARAQPLTGERLVILTNGGGPGVMAADTLIAAQGRLAVLPPATLAKLDAVLPAGWSRANPVDVGGDAPEECYVRALEILLREPNADAILFIHAPSATVSSADIAAAIAPIIKSVRRNVLACWLGAQSVSQARRIFAEAGIPTFGTPEKAVRGFMQIVQYRHNQELLMQVPSSIPEFREDREKARSLVQQVLKTGGRILSEPQARQMLAAYGIPVVETRTVASVEDAVEAAQAIGYPVALKILSPDVLHKSDVGGVMLDLENADAVRAAAVSMAARLRANLPNANLTGYSVQAMARRRGGQELIVGMSTDPTFGPVVLFGQGGVTVELTADHVLALPPLNMVLARDLISRTRIARLLERHGNYPGADIEAICHTLIRISDMITDIPELVELDINPLLADSEGVIALDARMRVEPAATGDGLARLAIRPYPKELEEYLTWHGEALLLRPIRPEDGQRHLEFFNRLDPEDVRFRVFSWLRELSPLQLARLTQIDYDRSMAFIATRTDPNAPPETLGVARVVIGPDNVEAEFAIVVRSDAKGGGLGKLLMQKLVRYCRDRGLRRIVGETLTYNRALLGLARKIGFQARLAEDGVTRLELDLTSPK